MNNKATVTGRLPSLNEYINKCRYNRFAGNQMKKEYQQHIINCCKDLDVSDMKYPMKMIVCCYEDNNRRDVDNVSAIANKFILDSLVASEKIIDDSRKYINAIENNILYDKNNPRIEIELVENSNTPHQK